MTETGRISPREENLTECDGMSELGLKDRVSVLNILDKTSRNEQKRAESQERRPSSLRVLPLKLTFPSLSVSFWLIPDLFPFSR